MPVKAQVPQVGQQFTNGSIVLTVVGADASGVQFNNGYCPNLRELANAWELVEPYYVAVENADEVTMAIGPFETLEAVNEFLNKVTDLIECHGDDCDIYLIVRASEIDLEDTVIDTPEGYVENFPNI